MKVFVMKTEINDLTEKVKSAFSIFAERHSPQWIQSINNDLIVVENAITISRVYQWKTAGIQRQFIDGWKVENIEGDPVGEVGDFAAALKIAVDLWVKDRLNAVSMEP